MKRIIAIIIALAALAGCACAEGTDAVTIGLLNPKVSANGVVLLDLARLDVETSLVFDGDSAIGVMLDLNAGERFETNVFSGQARWDDAGIVFSLDGTDRLYNVSVPGTLISSGRGFWRLLHPTDSPVPYIDFTALTAEQRVALLEAVLEPYLKDKLVVGDEHILSFDISQDDGTLIVSGLVGLLDQIAPTLVRNSVLSLFGKEDGLGINLKGKVTVTSDGIKLDTDGSLIALKDGAIIPLVQTLAQSYDGFSFSLGLGENRQGQVSLMGRRDQMTGDYSVTLEETLDGAQTASGTFTRGAKADRIRYELDYVNADGTKLYGELTDGLARTDPDVELELRVTPAGGEGERRVAVKYAGTRIEADGQLGSGGPFTFTYEDSQGRYDVESTVVVVQSGDTVRYAQWAAEANGDAVELVGGSEEEIYQFETDLSVIAAGALTKLQTQVPGVRELLSALESVQQ